MSTSQRCDRSRTNKSWIDAWLAALAVIVAVTAPGEAQEGKAEGASLSATIGKHEPRIWVQAKVNDSTVRLWLDTCAEHTILFRPATERLKLRVTEPETTGDLELEKVAFSITDPCRVRLGEFGYEKVRMYVVDAPRSAARSPDRLRDGVLGWYFLRQGVLSIDWDTQTVAFGVRLPDEARDLTRWKIRPGSPVLVAEVLSTKSNVSRIVIDTGHPGGVFLGPRRWQQWSDREGSGPLTLRAGYSPASGLHIDPIRWAKRLELLGISVEGMPVGRTNSQILPAMGTEAMIGLFGLSRFNVYIDGPNNVMYLKPRDRFAWKHTYNRLGAVFVPKSMEKDALLAHVIPDSPAHRAGIRHGDELLKVQGVDATRWKTDPKARQFSRFWKEPAGTELKLRLRRAGKDFDVIVKLEEIFPDSSKYDP